MTEGIDRELASALRGEAQPAQLAAVQADPALALQRVHYHGLAGLLTQLQGWPPALGQALRQEALARAMWELSHRRLLASLLRAFAERGIRSLLLKGTTLAYGAYGEPAHRTRGDTDLWVAPADLAGARRILADEGFTSSGEALEPEAMQLEEGWTLSEPGRHAHVLDLHWSAVNSLALRSLFDFEDCWSRRKPLPALSPEAWSLSDSDALLHTAVHRRLHVVSPYEVGGVLHYGGDRLIWAFDIHLLAARLGTDGLRDTVSRAGAMGLGPALAEALSLARRSLGSELRATPHTAARRTQVSAYLAGGQVRRAWLDLGQLPGVRPKLTAVSRRIMPSRRFLEVKYGGGEATALSRLLVRRMVHFLRKRPADSGR